MALANQRTDIPVTIDESLCIQGCTLCVESCPLDSLAINPTTGKPGQVCMVGEAEVGGEVGFSVSRTSRSVTA